MITVIDGGDRGGVGVVIGGDVDNDAIFLLLLLLLFLLLLLKMMEVVMAVNGDG